MVLLVNATSNTKRPDVPTSLNHNHQRHHHSRQQQHQLNRNNHKNGSRIKKFGGNHGIRMQSDDFGGIYQHIRERKPNIVFILTDDQDVELGN